MNHLLLSSVIWIMVISLATCSNQVNDKPGMNETVSESRLNPAQNTGSSDTDSLITGKAELGKIYTQAITTYIEAIHKKEKTIFNTLFLGKQFEFPDIDLPATIGGAAICLLEPEDINNKKSFYGKSSPYINLIAFIGNNKAEFIFVTFYPEFNHQYDCYVNFRYNPEKKEFDLDKLRIEVLVRDKEGKAGHFAVYEDGKYVGDKPIEGNRK